MVQSNNRHALCLWRGLNYANCTQVGRSAQSTTTLHRPWFLIGPCLFSCSWDTGAFGFSRHWDIFPRDMWHQVTHLSQYNIPWWNVPVMWFKSTIRCVFN